MVSLSQAPVTRILGIGTCQAIGRTRQSRPLGIVWRKQGDRCAVGKIIQIVVTAVTTHREYAQGVRHDGDDIHIVPGPGLRIVGNKVIALETENDQARIHYNVFVAIHPLM